MAAARPTGPARPDAAVVRIHDVARVELGAQNYNQSCLFDGRPSVGLAFYQLPGTNALDVADAVRKKMEELKSRFPDGVAYDVGYDTVPFVRESIADVVLTMFEAVALVGLVVLVFLQDWKAMVLPMIDVPVSIIGTFAVMAVVGFSLNNISLFGLVVTIGIVVDDAIVVLENIERMLARGHDIRTATIKAMEEVTGPIIAVAVVLCAVFVPCAFIGGITGGFFRQFALTISVSTLISAINAITMTPSRAVLLFKTEAAGAGHQTAPGGLALVDLRRRRRGHHGVVGSGVAECCGGARPRLAAADGAGAGPARGTAGPGSGGLSASASGGAVRRRRPDRRRGRLGGDPAGERRAGLGVPQLQSRSSTGCRESTAGRWADCSASAWWCWRPTACCWP